MNNNNTLNVPHKASNISSSCCCQGHHHTITNKTNNFNEETLIPPLISRNSNNRKAVSHGNMDVNKGNNRINYLKADAESRTLHANGTSQPLVVIRKGVYKIRPLVVDEVDGYRYNKNPENVVIPLYKAR